MLLKCNGLVAPRNAATATRILHGANTVVCQAVKATREYSKSPCNPLQRAVGRCTGRASQSLAGARPQVSRRGFC